MLCRDKAKEARQREHGQGHSQGIAPPGQAQVRAPYLVVKAACPSEEGRSIHTGVLQCVAKC